MPGKKKTADVDVEKGLQSKKKSQNAKSKGPGSAKKAAKQDDSKQEEVKPQEEIVEQPPEELNADELELLELLEDDDTDSLLPSPHEDEDDPMNQASLRQVIFDTNGFSPIDILLMGVEHVENGLITENTKINKEGEVILQKWEETKWADRKEPPGNPANITVVGINERYDKTYVKYAEKVNKDCLNQFKATVAEAMERGGGKKKKIPPKKETKKEEDEEKKEENDSKAAGNDSKVEEEKKDSGTSKKED